MRVNIKHRTARGVLVAAQALIADPESWTKKDHARMTQPDTLTDGGPVLPTDPDASCWCVDGAVLRALSGPQGRIDRDDEILEQFSFSPLYVEACDVLREAVEAVRDRSENVGDERWAGMWDKASHVHLNDARETAHADVMELLSEAIVIAGERERAIVIVGEGA